MSDETTTVDAAPTGFDVADGLGEGEALQLAYIYIDAVERGLTNLAMRENDDETDALLWSLSYTAAMAKALLAKQAA